MPLAAPASTDATDAAEPSWNATTASDATCPTAKTTEPAAAP